LKEICLMNDESKHSLRIDRWLWFTRFYKTRRLATAAVSGGHIRVNGERAKPGSKIAAGDIIEIVREQLPYRLEAGPLPSRRGPASEARGCYLEDEATRVRREEIKDSIRNDRQQMPRTQGRPDKHTRKLLRDRNRGRRQAD
jgi:ribosome-associated heat shock protein Hsp15